MTERTGTIGLKTKYSRFHGELFTGWGTREKRARFGLDKNQAEIWVNCFGMSSALCSCHWQSGYPVVI